MPQMGYDMQEGTIVRWLKSEGAEVKVGEPIAEIETDKAVVEFESYAGGVLQKILAPEGSTVPVGEPIAIVGAAGEAPPEKGAPPAREKKEERPRAEADGRRAPEAPAAPRREAEAPPQREEAPAAPAGEVRASPVARRIAEERGVSLLQVKGTGPGGRITKEDVLAFAEGKAEPAAARAPTTEPSVQAQPAPERPPRPEAPPRAAERPAAGERVPLSRMRQQIARVTVRSKTEKPHFYVSADIEMTQAMALRQQINKALESEGVRVTVNDLILKACVEALEKFPKFNAYFEGDALVMNEKINIGVAMAIEEGLLMPAIMDCGSKSLREISRASKDLAERAQKGTLHPEEYTGGTFAVSNLGMFDVTSFIAIIQPPQTAILAVGTVAKRPVVKDDEIAIAQMMTATIAADHRVVDGAEGARFLIEVKRLLENPMLLLL